MTRRWSLALAWVLSIGLPGRGGQAQVTDPVDSVLQHATAALDSSNTERAVDLLRQLISSFPAGTVREQRARAHIQLAVASWALQQPDSTRVHFRSAVRWDPFARLAPDLYNPEISSLFQAARETTTSVGLRAPLDTTLVPTVERFSVRAGVARPGTVSIRLVALDPATPDSIVMSVAVDTVATVLLPLTGSNGGVLDPGRYRLYARLETAIDSLSLVLDRSSPDTLPHAPPVPVSQLRPETRRASPSVVNIIRGLALGAAAGAIPMVLGNSQVRDGSIPFTALAVGLSIAGVDIVFDRGLLPIPQNIVRNAALRRERERQNQTIAAENERRRRLAPVRLRVERQP